MGIRCLDCIEYFRLIGWHDSDWRPFKWKDIFEDEAHCNSGCANLAGNAYSGYQCGAFQMALMATWARYGRHSQQLNDDGPVDAENNDVANDSSAQYVSSCASDSD